MNASRMAPVAKAFLLALLGISSARAGWTVTEGFHQWPVTTGSFNQTFSLKPGDLKAVPDSLYGYSNPWVDSRGQVYFTKPSQLYSPGGNTNSVGVPFISVFGGVLQADSATSKCQVQDDLIHVYLTCTEFKIQSGIASIDTSLKNVRISFQVSSSTNSGIRTGLINYVVERRDTSKISTAINKMAFLWDGSQTITVAQVDSILAIPLQGQNLVLMGGGAMLVPAPYHNSFADTQAFDSFELPTPTRQNLRIVAGSGSGSRDEGYYWNLSSPHTWREFDSLVVRYSEFVGQNGVPSGWRVWFFNDGAHNGEVLNIHDLPQYANRYAQSVASFGSIPSEIDAGVTDWRNLLVDQMKVMCNNCQNDTFELDSVYLTRAQPSSFQLQLTSAAAIPTSKITVQVLGTADSGVSVSLTGCATKNLITNASGQTEFDSIPDGTCRLDFSKSGSVIDPSSRVFQLSADQNIIVQSYRGVPTILQQAITVREGQVATVHLDTGWVQDPLTPHSWQMSWSLAPLDGNTALPLTLDPASRTLTLGTPGGTLSGTGRFLLTVTNPYGASASDTLTAQIIAVDQPPKIPVIHWTLLQNGLFSVALDSVYKGSGVWAVDPDNIPSSLRWSAVVDRSSKDVGQVSIQSNRLTLVPAVNSLDPILLDLAVRDSAGLKDSIQILVPVYKRPACPIRRKRPVDSEQSGRVPWQSERLQGTR